MMVYEFCVLKQYSETQKATYMQHSDVVNAVVHCTWREIERKKGLERNGRRLKKEDEKNP